MVQTNIQIENKKPQILVDHFTGRKFRDRLSLATVIFFSLITISFVFLIIGSQDTEKDMRIRDVQQRLGRVGRLVGGIYADGCGNNGTFPIGTHTDEQARLVGKPIAGITAVARSDLVGRAIVETAYEMVNGQLVSVTSDNVIVCTPDTADDDLVAQVGLKARVPVTIERAFLDDISAV